MASHMAERENRNVTGRKRERERRNIDWSKDSLASGWDPEPVLLLHLKTVVVVMHIIDAQFFLFFYENIFVKLVNKME